MRNEMKQLALKLDCYVLGRKRFRCFHPLAPASDCVR